MRLALKLLNPDFSPSDWARNLMVASRTASGFILIRNRPLSTVVLLPLIPSNDDKLCTPDPAEWRTPSPLRKF
jgi:hypothetical protein